MRRRAGPVGDPIRDESPRRIRRFQMAGLCRFALLVALGLAGWLAVLWLASLIF